MLGRVIDQLAAMIFVASQARSADGVLFVARGADRFFHLRKAGCPRAVGVGVEPQRLLRGFASEEFAAIEFQRKRGFGIDNVADGAFLLLEGRHVRIV